MRITGFNQFDQMQNSSFKLGKSNDEDSTETQEITANEGVIGERKLSQKNLEFQLEKAMRKSSDFLKKGLDKIFDNGEKLLSGRNTEEYQKHIDELGKAIQGQDFKRAEELIDRFYKGDSEKIITRIHNLAEAAEDNFWKNVEGGLSFLKDDGQKWTMFVDGKERDDLSTLDLAKMAIEKSRTEVDEFASDDLSDLVNSTRTQAAAYAKGKLENAGRNKYSEDAHSVTRAATDYAKGKIFNTDDSNYEEDLKVLKDIDELKENEGITQEQVDRLKHQNTRKGDKFSKFMRGRTKSFNDEFDRLRLAATPRTVEEQQNTEAPQQNNQANGPQLKAGLEPQLLSLDVDSMISANALNSNDDNTKKTTQYLNRLTEDAESSIDWKI